ncbi:MAG: GIY-YIG nuclease family protein [Candidatus Krumholzibacteriia bacterium]
MICGTVVRNVVGELGPEEIMSFTDEELQRPHAAAPENRGLYLFLVRLETGVRISVGALGEHDLPPGWYVYTGRARRNLVQRVRSHFKPHKKVRWHIDRLIEQPAAVPLGAVLLSTREHPDLSECELNSKVGVQLGARAPVPGFGASDCSRRCPAHLWYVPHAVSLLQLASVSPKAAMVLPRRFRSADGPSPEWPLSMPRYFQVDPPGRE